MTTQSNDSSATTQNLPVAPEPGRSRWLQQPTPDASTASPEVLDQPNLADDDRRGRLARQMRHRLTEADYLMQTRVRHPDGGQRTVAETCADEDDQRQLISQDLAQGSRKHRRLSRWQHWIPKFVLFFDFVLLLYFFAGITNVDWQRPTSMNLLFATALAAMVTVLAYGLMAVTGHRMRSHKNHAGTLHLDELDGFTKAAFGIATTVITVLAVLMYLRIHTEVGYDLGPQAGITALIIPLAVAVVSGGANYLVVFIHALDGSDEVARLDKLAAATRRPIRKAHRLRRRAAQQAHR